MSDKVKMGAALLVVVLTWYVPALGEGNPGTPRFTVSADKVIRDTRNGLEWLVGPDHDTNYDDAENWVRSCTVAGGGWRVWGQRTLNRSNATYYRYVNVFECEGNCSESEGI